ncbi:MAG: hypothetical protein AMXMBFR58_21650 [Phycisphaerae bacterium]
MSKGAAALVHDLARVLLAIREAPHVFRVRLLHPEMRTIHQHVNIRNREMMVCPGREVRGPGGRARRPPGVSQCVRPLPGFVLG